MPELRCDPVTGNWVVIATERARRPESYVRQKEESKSENTVCPFCYGNEALTPPEVMAYREPDTGPNTSNWQIRVVPNKYPAFAPGATCPPLPAASGAGRRELGSTSPFCRSMGAVGFHEVIIHSPSHEKSLALLPEEQVVLIVRAYKDRYLALKKDGQIKYILIIVNHGKSAGASLAHPHSQLFALPLLPKMPQEELLRCARHHQNKGSCMFCEIIEEEKKQVARLITESEHFFAFCPYASRSPFETWILPKRHNASFETITTAEERDLAKILRLTLRAFYKSLGDPPYNLYLHTAPPSAEDFSQSYHWHIELFPKITLQAGFEMGTGIMINVVKPGEAAGFLRGFKDRED